MGLQPVWQFAGLKQSISCIVVVARKLNIDNDNNNNNTHRRQYQ